MDFVKATKETVKPSFFVALYLMVSLVILGYGATFIGFSDYLYNFPIKNFVGVLVTFTAAGIVKAVVEKGIVKKEVDKIKGRTLKARVQRGIFNGIYYTVGLWAVGFLARYIGFEQYLLDFQVAANFFSVFVTLTLAAIVAEYLQEKLKKK